MQRSFSDLEYAGKLIGTAGNVSDVTQAHALLHGNEVAAMGDA